MAIINNIRQKTVRLGQFIVHLQQMLQTLQTLHKFDLTMHRN